MQLYVEKQEAVIITASVHVIQFVSINQNLLNDNSRSAEPIIKVAGLASFLIIMLCIHKLLNVLEIVPQVTVALYLGFVEFLNVFEVIPKNSAVLVILFIFFEIIQLYHLP